MKDQERKLIIDLFDKLKKLEQQNPHRDIEAENIINQFLKNHSNMYYYMVQTILVQELMIKELNDKIKNLQLEKNNLHNKNSSFLSGNFKDNVSNTPNDQSISRTNFQRPIQSENVENRYTVNRTATNTSGGGISSFLGSALQTAVGVAGGMVAGNMISNLFHGTNSNNADNVSNDTHHTEHLNAEDHINNSEHDNVIDSNSSHNDNVDHSDSSYSNDQNFRLNDIDNHDDMYEIDDDMHDIDDNTYDMDDNFMN